MLQVEESYRGQMQDGDHSEGHYITLFAEQLTRTFEVLVILTGYSEGFILTGVVICMTPISMLWQPSWDVYVIVVDMSDHIHKVQS